MDNRRVRPNPGDAERRRLADGTTDRPGRWWLLGPYISERAWGTVREDYSADGSAWQYFPHDHARMRTYRWNEDGLAGICDVEQRMCFALAFWNGRDPILKERIFGLAGHEGNHGEDAKEYWWYVDSLRRLHAGLGPGFSVELPTGSGRQADLGAVADELERRLVSLFLPDGSGRRPFHGNQGLFQRDPASRDLVLFHEYFNGDTGEGLGASHQTGWTALIGAMLASRPAIADENRGTGREEETKR